MAHLVAKKRQEIGNFLWYISFFFQILAKYTYSVSVNSIPDLTPAIDPSIPEELWVNLGLGLPILESYEFVNFLCKTILLLSPSSENELPKLEIWLLSRVSFGVGV